MLQPVDPLMLQFLAWVASRRRTYAEAMEAWQTTCPRHTVWEDALIDRMRQRWEVPDMTEAHAVEYQVREGP